jgi:hypothetical protein
MKKKIKGKIRTPMDTACESCVVEHKGAQTVPNCGDCPYYQEAHKQ